MSSEKRPSAKTMRKLAAALASNRPFVATAKRLAKAEGMDINTLRRRAFEARIREPWGRSKVAQRFAEIVAAKGGTLLDTPLLPDLRCRVRCSCGREFAPFPQNVVYRGTWCPECSKQKRRETIARKDQPSFANGNHECL